VAPPAEAPAATVAPAAVPAEGHKFGGEIGGGGIGLKLVSARPASGGAGPVATGPALLEVDATTINLTDGHFLKVGVTLELSHGSDTEAQKTHGTGGLARSELIAALSGKSMEELGAVETREQILHQLGYSVCKKTDGGVTKAYYTDFVMQ
jgi:flagellar basal body-associated protein FliL